MTRDVRLLLPRCCHLIPELGCYLIAEGFKSNWKPWCAWRESNPLPCGPEPHRGVSTAVRMVVADAPPYSAMASPVRDMPDWFGASLGICDPVVIPDEPPCRSGVITGRAQGF
jgi:hypothetical protein